MKDYSRRQFLKQLGAFSALCLTARGKISAGDSAPFEFLVVGDSLVWGQGLREEEKFYALTKNWLETEIFKNKRRVEMKVLAHSGASINLRDFEIEGLEKGEISQTEFFPREINVSFPSIHTQVDLAVTEYENPAAVDLIMLSGGITDVRLTQILNPLKGNDKLRSNIAQCGEAMFELLTQTAKNFPQALIVLVGYYPPLSKYTPSSRIFSNLLELYKIPQPFKALINSPLNRQILQYYHKKMVKRALIWAHDSTVEFKKAVSRLNAEFGKERVIFIESPLKEENSLGAKDSMLFEIKKGKINDAFEAERKATCKTVLKNLREKTDLDFRTRTCDLATVGHPNAKGSRAYFEAIQNSLRKFFESGS